ncbi:Homocysteine methyltransferase [Corynebacterium glyciniphilum AJ 3170]|uniref:Homocysteine methyltransferase n=2 Tax=Corynebacterium TaxID=1716 RepID=X5DN44_9CORY|nr:Homocysteine methyltransferase [Corynebacterium glyciniphilum AJ 3170]
MGPMTDPVLPRLILDGGLGTRLADRGNDISGSLWSAQILRDNPDEVTAAHRDFFDAGADVATTCSYEVTTDGLLAAGVAASEADDLADSLLRQSVRLAVAAAEQCGTDALIAASVGPYGAGPGRGTEYDGDYGLTTAQLAAWHRRRVDILADTEADVLLAETVPSIREVEALAGELDRAGTPALLSVTVKPGSDGVLSDGTDVREVAAIASSSSAIRAVGVNCGSVGDVLAGARRLAEHTDLPLIAYPNSGERWDHAHRVWVPRQNDGGPGLLESVPDFLEAGVRLLGGCCRVTPREIAAVRDRALAY